MQLSPQDIESFIDMWEAEFGERISPATADTEAKRLIAFFVMLAEARLDATGNEKAAHGTMPA